MAHGAGFRRRGPRPSKLSRFGSYRERWDFPGSGKLPSPPFLPCSTAAGIFFDFLAFQKNLD
jgi:hypothetical protein